jgi:GMP synthase (glutamine-hydrolysing)
MRKNESAVIAKRYRSFGFTNFIVEDASALFLEAIAGEYEPQRKRVIVGETFITARNAVVARLHLKDDEWLLAQGTLYPDIIESGGTENAHIIKTHHNRVAGIQALIAKGQIIEPLKDLYKDEVRLIGLRLGLPEDLIMRHPFPGPGLSITVLCNTSDGGRAEVFRETFTCFDRQDYAVAKAAVADWSAKQTPALQLGVLPVRSVGVQGDFRTYRYPAIYTLWTESKIKKQGKLTWRPLDWDAIEVLSSRLTNALPEVNRLVVELFRRSPEPPLPEDGEPPLPTQYKRSLRLQVAFCDKARLDQTREADAIELEELHKSGWYKCIFQHLTISLPFAYKPTNCSIVLRPVVSEDVMTARFARLPRDILAAIVSRISRLPFIDAIFYDVTNKPPATFGWE